MIGIAHHVASPTSNDVLLASDAHSLLQVLASTPMAINIHLTDLWATLVAITILITVITALIIMVVVAMAAAVIMVEATDLSPSEQEIGDAVPKDARTITLQRTLIAFDAVPPALVQLSLSTSPSRHLWVPRLTSAWVTQAQWQAHQVQLRTAQVPRLLALALLSLSHHQTPMPCHLVWGLLVQASLRWAV